MSRWRRSIRIVTGTWGLECKKTESVMKLNSTEDVLYSKFIYEKGVHRICNGTMEISKV